MLRHNSRLSRIVEGGGGVEIAEGDHHWITLVK